MYSYFNHYNRFSVIANVLYQKGEKTNTIAIEQKNIITQLRYIMSAKPNDFMISTILLEKGLSFIPCIFELVGGSSYYIYSNQISSKVNEVKNLNYNIDATLVSKYNSPLNGELSAKLNVSNYKSTISEDIMHRTQEYGGKLKVKFSSKFYGETEFTYTRNSVYLNLYKIYMLNSLIRYNLNKKVAFIFKGNNVLHLDKNNWYATSFYNNYQIEHQYKRIPGYVIISTNIRF